MIEPAEQMAEPMEWTVERTERAVSMAVPVLLNSLKLGGRRESRKAFRLD